MIRRHQRGACGADGDENDKKIINNDDDGHADNCEVTWNAVHVIMNLISSKTDDVDDDVDDSGGEDDDKNVDYHVWRCCLFQPVCKPTS